MKLIKKTTALLFALSLCFSLSTAARAVVSQSESFYAADYANVLSNATEEMIINYNGALETQCQGAQIVVVTVDYLDGMYSDEYAYQLFNDWGVGSSEYNNGMLLLLATQENKAWLAYGMGLNSLIDGDDVDKLLEDYFWKDFDRGNYDKAVTRLFEALLEWYDDKYDSSVVKSGTSGAAGSQNSGNESGGSTGTGVFSGLIRLVVIIAVLALLFGGNHRGRGGGSWLPWFLLFNNWNNRGGRGGRGGGFGGGGFSGGGGGRR